MNFNIALVSENSDADVDSIINLKKRLNENLEHAQIKQRQEALNADDAAAGILSALLDVIVGKEFLGNIIDTIKEWIKSRPAIVEARKSKLEIVVEHENGKKVSIKIENLKDLEKLAALTKAVSK